MNKQSRLTFLEFFAGGGMARAGLGSSWECLFANDIDAKKGLAYQANWGVSAPLRIADINSLTVDDLPKEKANLAWASFPCQDLSLAGRGAGLLGERSGTFHGFWEKVSALGQLCHWPDIIVLENVVGLITSHNGGDFTEVCQTFCNNGYMFGALVVDAKDFVPQSRPRLFFIGYRSSAMLPSDLAVQSPIESFHTKSLVDAYDKLSSSLKKSWTWFSLPKPARRNTILLDCIENNPSDVKWHSSEQTKTLIDMMSEANLAKLASAKAEKYKTVGCLYKRTRIEKGERRQRAEVRFDDIAGCLRTPIGGSSRQTIVVVEGERVRTRLLSSREAARLMGLPESYVLPKRYNEAYHLTGDGVAVPVVRFLSENILEPILNNFNNQNNNKIVDFNGRKIAV